MVTQSRQANMPSLVIIAAMDQRLAIGRGLDIPWRLPDDFAHFKRLTIGKPNIMGWNTALSLGRALPKRRNIVISRSRQAPWEGMETFRSFEEAVEAAGTGLTENDEIMVIGGSSVYAQALPVADRMHLTNVYGEFENCDVFFPRWDRRQWRICGWEHRPVDERHEHAFDFIGLERIQD